MGRVKDKIEFITEAPHWIAAATHITFLWILVLKTKPLDVACRALYGVCEKLTYITGRVVLDKEILGDSGGNAATWKEIKSL